MHLKANLKKPVRSLARRIVYLSRVVTTSARLPTDTLNYASEVLRVLPGRFPRECPICGYQGFFQAYGLGPRLDALCPECKSLERHRLLYLCLVREGRIANCGTLLHFAPEPVLSEFMSEYATDYITADICMPGVRKRLDIEQMDLEDEACDTIVCNHVLEHVNEVRALGELYRVLRTGGRLYCMIPIVEGWERTYENAAITDEAGRALHFGQPDHLRWFGRDFRKRLMDAGFNVEEYTASGEDVARYGLSRGETVFICLKP